MEKKEGESLFDSVLVTTSIAMGLPKERMEWLGSSPSRKCLTRSSPSSSVYIIPSLHLSCCVLYSIFYMYSYSRACYVLFCFVFLSPIAFLFLLLSMLLRVRALHPFFPFSSTFGAFIVVGRYRDRHVAVLSAPPPALAIGEVQSIGFDSVRSVSLCMESSVSRGVMAVDPMLFSLSFLFTWLSFDRYITTIFEIYNEKLWNCSRYCI